ncbi:unnamed protein product [Urochloa humidicola]
MAEAPDDGPACTFSYCFCRWLRRCSPEIPRVGCGVEYAFIPEENARSSIFCSVVVGVVSKFDDDSSLRLHRFRVARSGRVLGQSDDALEILVDDVAYKPKNTWSRIRAAGATRSPDGRTLSLCLFSRELHLLDLKKAESPRPVELLMDLGAADDSGPRVTVSTLPRLPLGPLKPILPINAAGAGDLWAPYLTELDGPSCLVMQRFDKDAGHWVEVADLDLPQSDNPGFLGFAVVGCTILLSLTSHLFFSFNCSTLVLKPVYIDETRWGHYVPMQKRCVFVEEDDTIYFLYDGSVYACNLFQMDQHHYMPPPVMVDRVYPFLPKEGTGFLAHLGGRIMCYVWIGEKLECNCDTKHVLITTFRIIGDDHCDREHGHFPGRCFVPSGIEVLHSTCRRLSKPNGRYSFSEFSILQEYEEFNHENATAYAKNTRQDGVKGPGEVVTSSNVLKSFNMLACCREFIGTPLESAVMLERCPIQTNKTLYLVCQVASSAVVFEVNILDGKLGCHGKALTPHCTVDLETFIYDEDRPLPSHYVCDSKSIYVVSCNGDDICECSLDTMTPRHFPTRPIGDICLICKVGNNIVAITDTLQCVYSLSSEHGWMRHETYGIPGLERKVNLSGYVVLSDESFMVSDADSNRCFLFDLRDNKWRIVMPYALQDRANRLPSGWPGMAFLSERSVFAKGFVYTCSSGGLTAYELIEDGNSYFLGHGINLKFSWRNWWEHERMCLDCVGEDTSSGAIMFCVVQDDYSCQRDCPENHSAIRFTTVQVKTEGLRDGKLKPKTISHVDIGRSFIKQDARSSESDRQVIWARGCFAVDSF